MPQPLLDKLGRRLKDLRVSVTDRCNFRCAYCMPAEIYGERYEFLPRDQILTFEEITRLARLFAQHGVRKIRLTGGEPLLRREIETLVASLAAIDELDDLALTTNGCMLPQKAEGLRKAGLRRITVSLDTLDNDVFRRMNGRDWDVKQVLGGIRAAEDAGFHPIKINAVVQKGVNDHTLADLARFFNGTGHIVRFIEFMDVGNRNRWEMAQVVPAHEIVQRIDSVLPLEPLPPNYPGEVATRYRYLDGSGEIGVVGSVTLPFCRSCSRARLATDGQIYTCLFAGEGHDLRGPMRRGATDAELLDLIARIWSTREDRYSERRAVDVPEQLQKVEMYRIGG